MDWLSGMVCPVVQHTSYIVTLWAVLTSLAALAALTLSALAVALPFHCFWTFFIAASKKASDARFFSAALTLGRAIFFSLSLAQCAHCVYLSSPKVTHLRGRSMHALVRILGLRVMCCVRVRT